MATTGPLEFELVNIELLKFNQQEDQTISIIPQMIELNIYQSLYNPCIKAELTLWDPIGLPVNYPLLGEEMVVVYYKPTRNNLENDPLADGKDIRISNLTRPWIFMVNSISALKVDEKGKAMVYTLELFSIDMRENMRRRVQRSFNGPYHESCQTVLKDILMVDNTKLSVINFEPSNGNHLVVVPNLSPLETCAWFAKRAVPVDPNNHLYYFYETFNGYNFKTFESVFNQNVNLDDLPKYIYIADLNEASRKAILDQLNVPEHNVATAMKVHQRWDTIEKVKGGYFENEYFDIDTLHKTIHTSASVLGLNPISNKQYNYNTPNFITNIQTRDISPGSKHRVRYRISQDQGDNGDPNDQRLWSAKWPFANREITAMAQSSVTISAPGDTRINAGDLINFKLPELHGFNVMNEDPYITGRYVVVDIKHVVSVGMRHVMVMNLHRDGFDQPINEQMKYGPR